MTPPRPMQPGHPAHQDYAYARYFATCDCSTYVPWKARKAVATALHAIYGSATLAEAEQALDRFAERWDTHYPASSPSWLADWDRLTMFLDYPPAIRRAISTTKAMYIPHIRPQTVLDNRLLSGTE